MAVRANIQIDQGASFTAQVQLDDPIGDPIDLSGYEVDAQLRKNYASINSYSFTASGNSSGVIVLSMNASTTALVSSGRYVYDVLLTDGSGAKVRVLEGQVTVSPGVTR